MKNCSVLFVLFLFVRVVEAQILQPAQWDYAVSESKVQIGDEMELIFRATIDKDWYLYSSDFDPDLGPMLTEFEFVPNNQYELVGEIVPIDPSEKYDEIWEGNVRYFKGTGEFRQRVKITGPNPVISGSYSYQVCSDIDGKCIPFDDEFTFEIKIEGGQENSDGLTPQIKTESLDLVTKSEAENALLDEGAASTSPRQKDRKGLTRNVYEQGLDPAEESLIGFIIFAFLSGIIALLTPCVFPMIPMTVSFFLKENESSKRGAIKSALIFGGSIMFLFTVIGTLVALIFGADALNQMATHWIPNVFIFLVFFVFALSFLGMFEITLPSAFVNKIDKQADRGGYAGIFFMATTLALVSFSCTFPIVGSVLVLSSQGEFVKPIMGMFAFSLAFGLPFTIFAAFPGLLKNLPKSGGWLNSVKVFLGFLELALGLKFLSVADQAYHWGILDREIYLAFWIVIFALMGFYLLGKLRLPHDSVVEFISVPRMMLAIIIFTFVVYLIPGMFGAPLKALAGYLPPMSTHDFNMPQTREIGYFDKDMGQENLCDKPKYADFLHFPHAIKGYFDYEQAVACARELDKPIFIDFTGHGCVNCREMEARVWSDPEVLTRLKNDFIMVALYVDDKTELPESEWYTSEYDNKVKRTIGKQNADLQITRYNNNAQPFYIVLGRDEEMLLDPKAYDLSISNFVDYLDAAKKAYESSK